MFAGGPEPLAEMFLLPRAAAWCLNGNIADHNHCSGIPSHTGSILENESMETQHVSHCQVTQLTSPAARKIMTI